AADADRGLHGRPRLVGAVADAREQDLVARLDRPAREHGVAEVAVGLGSHGGRVVDLGPAEGVRGGSHARRGPLLERDHRRATPPPRSGSARRAAMASATLRPYATLKVTTLRESSARASTAGALPPV